MRWRVIITPRAERELKGLQSPDQARIREALDGLTDFPRQGDLRKLRGREEEWRLRVGDYRVRFTPDSRNRVISILRVLPRSQAYRE